MSSRWQMWIDTGGTFTDAVARPPGEGELRRAKVLSSSALRGEVTAVPGPRRLPVGPGWEVPADFFAGCTLHRSGGGASGGVAVAGYDAATGTFELDSALPASAGDHVEIRSPEEAPVLAARLLTATPHGRPLPPMALRLATTRGTNALLERRGAAVSLFVTSGFADLLEIGTQQRPDLFALEVRKPPPLYRRVVEVGERLDADGGVLAAPDLDAVEAAARRALEDGCGTAAVALLHSYANPAHERAVAERLRSAGFPTVAESAALAPLIKLLPRAETAVVEAYLAPVLESYLDGVAAALPPAGAADAEDGGGGVSTLHVMTSAGGLVRRRDFRAKDSLLSGPAGGVAGAARAGRRAGYRRLLSFDMGGTSTDVARWDGDFEYRFEQRVGEAHLVAPALAIETVAAGGGSICAHAGGRLQVGPQSAGARPGPACYGGGGPLTLTDVNLLLGLLDPDRFGIPVDVAAAEAAGEGLVAAVGGEQERAALLAGCRVIADERMADAIRSISVRRGYDPAEHALVAFGGAGGQHACAVAGLLGVTTVLVPPDAGLLSAFGLGGAVVERFAQRQVLRPLREMAAELSGLLAELEGEAVAAVENEAAGAGEVAVRRRILHLRFAGQESALAVEPETASDAAALRHAFAAAYRERYGYLPEEREIEVESVRVVASSRQAGETGAPPAVAPHAPSPVTRRRCYLGAAWRRVPVHERASLTSGAAFAGPALVFERHGATVVEPGWEAKVDAAGTLVLERR